MTENEAVEKMRSVMRRKHLAWKTEESYMGWVRRYCAFLCDRRPEGDAAKKMEVFLSGLARGGVSAVTQNQAFHAVRFFYVQAMEMDLGDVNALRAKRRVHVRHAPTVAQMAGILQGVRDRNGYPVKLICHLLYGCGLRVCEPLDLRIKDVDLEAMRIIVREAKGGKDRAVAVPDCLGEALRTQLARAAAVWEADKREGLPVQLPGGLARKYPAARFSRGWAFVFPGHEPCAHPREGGRVRYRMHEANVQRAVREVAHKLGLEGVVTPHVFRHAYATHVMREGAYVRDVQMVMGHQSLETTMGYLHAEQGRVRSPLKVVFSAA